MLGKVYICRLYIHLAFTYSIGPLSVAWSEFGPAPPFPPMGVLEVQWSWAPRLVGEVTLTFLFSATHTKYSSPTHVNCLNDTEWQLERVSHDASCYLYDKSRRPLWSTWHTNFKATLNLVSSVSTVSSFITTHENRRPTSSKIRCCYLVIFFIKHMYIFDWHVIRLSITIYSSKVKTIGRTCIFNYKTNYTWTSKQL